MGYKGKTPLPEGIYKRFYIYCPTTSDSVSIMTFIKFVSFYVLIILLSTNVFF